MLPDGSVPLSTWVPTGEPLCKSMKHAVEEYRFLWVSSFDGEALVRVGRGVTYRGENAVTVHWARSSYLHGTDPFWTCINRDGWDRLADAVIASGFWALDQEGEIDGLPGATWTIEGRRRDVYRAVRR